MEKIKRYRERLSIKNLLMLTFAGIINALGVILFLYPVKLYDSGISGTSMLLSQITPDSYTLSIFLLILNIPLFLYGLKRQGKLFTLYAIYTVAIYSISAWLITDILPIDVSTSSPFAGTDLVLCAIFGGTVSGIGSGLAIRYGGAMDGIEVMSVIFSKKLGISVGSFVMIYNALLYILAGVVQGSWTLPPYSIITYMATLKVIDFIVEGFDREKCAIIVTDKADTICPVLSEEFEIGHTKIEATGGYSGQKKMMVYFVVNRFQVPKLKSIVHEADPKAYIIISEVADVFKANQ